MKDFKVYQASGMLKELVKNASDVRKTEQTITGDIVSFTADTQSPMKIVVDIDSTGWTECVVYVSNVNLFDEEWELGTVSTSTGENNPSNTEIRVKNYIPVKMGEPFYLGWDVAQTGSVYGLVDVYKADKSFSRYFGAFTNPRSFTLDADEAYIRFYLYARTTPLVNAYIVFGTSATDYVPHQGTTAAVTFPNSVGTVTEGTLTIDYTGAVTLETGGQTYTLTSVSPIKTLIGDNNIWSDAGDVSVTYLI